VSLSKWKKRGILGLILIGIGDFGRRAERGREGYVVI
jgi:hypothetical protein